MYSPLLAGLLTGDERQAPLMEKHMKRATVYGYSRYSILDADFPALVHSSPESTTEGFLFYPRNPEDLKKMEDSECESYAREEVNVTDCDGDKVSADVFVWCDSYEDLTTEQWSFEEFKAKWERKQHRLLDAIYIVSEF